MESVRFTEVFLTSVDFLGQGKMFKFYAGCTKVVASRMRSLGCLYQGAVIRQSVDELKAFATFILMTIHDDFITR